MCLMVNIITRNTLTINYLFIAANKQTLKSQRCVFGVKASLHMGNNA